MGKVSIIVPIYNVEQYVEKCMKSLVNQTFRDIEIWAISDGSPDNSMQIVREFAKNDSRVKCIEKENGGYGSVLEYAIARIETEYFLICDPDDWLEENAVEVLYECAEKNKVDLVCGNKYLVFNDQKSKKIDQCFESFYIIEPNKVYDNLEIFTFMANAPHSKLYKTDLAKNIKFSHHVSYTDATLYFVYLTNIKNAIYLDQPLSNYFIDRPGNSCDEVKTLPQKAFNNNIIVLNSIFEQLDKNSYLYSAICYKLYTWILVLIKRMTRDIEKSKLNENKKEIITFLLKLEPQKRGMKKYIKSDNFLKTIMKKIIFELLFGERTRNVTLDCLITLKK